MRKRYVRIVGLVVAVAGLAGLLTAVAPAKPNKDPSASIVADFESYVNFAGTNDCPVSSGAVLVEGRGTATGPFGKFDSAIGTAAECSAPGFGTPPQLGTCDPSSIRTFAFFDVHGKGVYVTKDGSALFLSYHELSENPFELFPLPFFLHDCGVWTVDPDRASTGVFAGATGGGQISAVVPVRTDFSAHVNATYSGTLTLDPGAKGPKGSGDTHCAGTMSGPVPGNITVDDGAFCMLDTATVTGDVHVHKGGTLVMQYSIAGGNLDCNGCGSVTVFPATVLGDLHADRSGATTIISSIVGGDVDVHNGSGASTILLNPEIGRNLMVHDNNGFSTVAGNTAGHTIDCHGNNPAPLLTFQVPFPPQFGPGPVFTGNDAPALKGQCSLFGLGPQPPSGP
jgi:hypothetical protein